MDTRNSDLRFTIDDLSNSPHTTPISGAGAPPRRKTNSTNNFKSETTFDVGRSMFDVRRSFIPTSHPPTILSILPINVNSPLRGSSTQHPASLSSGQAMIEVMVGLIALLVLVAGLLQVASLTKSQTDTMVEAREDAGRRAFWDQALSESPDYIRDVQVGADGRSYSYDDTTTAASGAGFHDTIIAQTVSDPQEWDILEELSDQHFTALNNAGNPISTFGLLKGNASRTIPLRPAVRSLIYRAEEIEIESDVWMTWTKGIY